MSRTGARHSGSSGHRPPPARGAEIGSVIGAGFGLAFVAINSGGWPSALRFALLALSVAVVVAVLVAVLVLGLRRRRPSHPRDPQPGHPQPGHRPGHRPGERQGGDDAGAAARSPFGTAYWVVVLIEVIALFAGTRVLAVLGHPELGIAWVAVVVGTHFFALGRIFALARFHGLAVCVTACGLAGFTLAALGHAAAVPTVSGVVPGLLLLGFALWAVLPAVTTAPPSDRSSDGAAARG